MGGDAWRVGCGWRRRGWIGGIGWRGVRGLIGTVSLSDVWAWWRLFLKWWLVYLDDNSGGGLPLYELAHGGGDLYKQNQDPFSYQSERRVRVDLRLDNKGSNGNKDT